MTTYEFTVTLTDLRVRTVRATADRLEQATSNMLKALFDDGLDPAFWSHVEVSGS